MIALTLNGIVNTPGSIIASTPTMEEPANRPPTPCSTSAIEIVDSLDKAGYSIPISNNSSLDPSPRELEQGPRERPVHLRL
jgi:hypothetical protein